MITKEDFSEIYKTISKFVKEGEVLTKNPALNTDLMYDITGFGWEAIEKTLQVIFDKEGVDWIYWWFYEKSYLKSENKAFDKAGIPIPTETFDDLWNLIVDCIK